MDLPRLPSSYIWILGRSRAVRQRYASSTTRAGEPCVVSEVAWHPAYSNQQHTSLNTTVLTSPSTHLASLLIAHLSPEIYASYNLDSLSGHYFVYVPSRIGHNAGLDSAVWCICTSYSMSLKHVPEDGRIMWRLYLEAIRHLQETLRWPTAEETPEILCVSMILRLFEVKSIASPATYRC